MVKRFRKQLQLISGQPISLISFSILCWYIDGKLLSSMMKSKTSCSGQQLPLISGQQLLHLQNLIRNYHPGWWKVKPAVPVSSSFGFLNFVHFIFQKECTTPRLPKMWNLIHCKLVSVLLFQILASLESWIL